MLRKGKSLVVLCSLACAVSGVVASHAFAGWAVEGTELKSGELRALAEEVSIKRFPLVSIPSLGINFLCLGPIHLRSTHIFFPIWLLIHEIIFLNCHVEAPTPTQCQLVSKNGSAGNASIATVALLGEATLTRRIVKPESGKILTEIPFQEGTSCVLEGSQPVKGSVVLGAPSSTSELTEHEIEGLGSVENNSLEVGAGNKAFLTGAVGVKLESGSKWSFK